VKSWVFTAENGKTAVAIRYGARVLELARGKFAVEIASPAQLIPTLELIKTLRRICGTLNQILIVVR